MLAWIELQLFHKQWKKEYNIEKKTATRRCLIPCESFLRCYIGLRESAASSLQEDGSAVSASGTMVDDGAISNVPCSSGMCVSLHGFSMCFVRLCESVYSCLFIQKVCESWNYLCLLLDFFQFVWDKDSMFIWWLIRWIMMYQVFYDGWDLDWDETSGISSDKEDERDIMMDRKSIECTSQYFQKVQ